MSDATQEHRRFPLAYAGALAGLIAITSLVLFFYVVALLIVFLKWAPQLYLVIFTAYVFSPVMLASLGCPAAVTMAVVSGPIHIVIRKSGLSGPWPYMVATTCITGLGYVIFFRLDPRTYGMAALIPVASIPCGLLLFYLTQPVRRPESVEMRDALIIATWCAAWFWWWISGPISRHDMFARYGLDLMTARQVIFREAALQGLPAFMMMGIVGGLVRIWHLRAGTIIAGAAWLIPVTFVILYYTAPLAPVTR